MQFFLNSSRLLGLFFSLMLLPPLEARLVETFYGPVEVEETVLLDLIDSPAFQRLKRIHQYGVAYYTTHSEEYNRYDHSIGVFTVLRAHGASLEEQIAGLLHDVSHTAFSHVGDWVFGVENQEDSYQDKIHISFLEESGIATILRRHHYKPEALLPLEEHFPALESGLPNLCADRIDYNIQGAYYQGFITYKEAIAIFNDLQFIENQWIAKNKELMQKLARFSLFMTEDCWGSPLNHLLSRWLADAIIRAISIGLMSENELKFGEDQPVLEKLIASKDPLIQEEMKRIMNYKQAFEIVKEGSSETLHITSKFRGIDPLIQSERGILRLTQMDQSFLNDYLECKRRVQSGWYVKTYTPCLDLFHTGSETGRQTNVVLQES